MEQLKFFHFSGDEVRVVKKDNESWWVAKDLCNVLSIRNSRDALTRLDEGEKGVALIDTPGGKQKLAVVSESGVYTLILTSRKPENKQLKRWIMRELLPTIGKTGGYIANDYLFISTYLPHADELTKLMFKDTLETVRKANGEY